MNSHSSLKDHYHVGKSMKNFLTGYFTEYETPKLVLIHSAKYAGLLRILQIIILIYSVIYLLIYEQGYQKQSTTITSSVTLKVKGIGYVLTSENQTMIIDGADYIIPPSENNAIFIKTNFIQTDQTRSKCAENIKLAEAICKNDSDCFNKPFIPNMSGRWTGRCLLSPEKNVANETTNITKTETGFCEYADYIIPPSENNAIFIMTNFVQTDQTRSKCAESKQVKSSICTNDSDCLNKPFTPDMNGRWTGQCLLLPEKDVVNETTNITKTTTGFCEYAGWCPPEDDLTSTMPVQETLNFTIFIKNFIEFPEFGVKHKNMVDNLQQCTFDPKNDTDCPIFTIDYIMKEAEKNITELNLMLRYGGVVRIKLDWDCNLDRNIKRCKPEYSFARLDVPFHEKPFSRGFNFRHASYWKRNKKHFRTLTKAFGLRFIITISGKAGKFDFITLTLNIGSLVGLFGLGTIVCDILLLHLSKRARIYRNHVFEIVHLRTRASSTPRVPRISVQQHFDKHSLSHLNI
ncbi:unnamed protein product [Rotaria sp. Silwood2]|nr:unnamed protein product [Rotaria sp. Silwood2]